MAYSSHKFKIAVVGLPNLLNFAFQKLIEEISDRCVVETYKDLEEITGSIDFHLISVDVFLSHLQFFMPRKQHIAIVKTDFGFHKKNLADDILILNTDMSADILKSKLSKAIDCKSESDNPSGELTPRETEVLSLLSKGLTVKEIAVALGISVNTALTHRKNLSSKLGIRSVSGLSLYAMMNGLL